ncbi:MAG: response regulator transcription factor [Gemmatimonadetes bacterium]|nr:response regulator transcription factor [Gemmatimonadota bacterium]MCY3611171.1 response regulator transcription factor [Gemmatimonadota bacterium]MCY3678102.1 response regulator transcription factor [Gemmatimonadota bacterium]MYA42186.1 response regulator transcription factor [Gemmatimonadota bacterium]MYE95154.1 response regulator transcription factor [Gemmatimonadota bacterium]
MVRVLLVDDHNVVRAGLRALLESMGRVDVVGEASSGEEAVDRARMLEPDIVIMDLAMPGMDGVEATRRITKLGIDTKVLVLTIHDEDEFLIPALDAGAEGFLNKSVADTDLLGAVEALARGHSYLPRRVAALLARKKAQGAADRESDPEVLSSRERVAVGLYAQGFSTREMAREMDLSPKTVEGYIARVKTKLGLHTRRDIVRFALETGLLRAEGEQ